MGIETRERTIGDCRYLVTQMTRTPSLRVQAVLFRALAAAASNEKGISLDELGLEGLKFDLHAILKALSTDELEMIEKTLAEHTRVITRDKAGEHGPFDLAPLREDHFAGSRVWDAWKWLAFAIEVQFVDADFFTRLSSRLAGMLAAFRAKAATKAESPSPSPAASTGTSGASSSAAS